MVRPSSILIGVGGFLSLCGGVMGLVEAVVAGGVHIRLWTIYSALGLPLPDSDLLAFYLLPVFNFELWAILLLPGVTLLCAALIVRAVNTSLSKDSMTSAEN